MTTKIKDLTGPGLTDRFGVGGTDLGFPFRLSNGSYMYIFGDTFENAGVGGPGWRSPVGLRSRTGTPTGRPLSEGIVWDNAAGGTYAKQLVRYEHDTSLRPGATFTLIPCDAITIGSKSYLEAVSIRDWNSSDPATVTNYGELFVCDDPYGEDWRPTGVRWTGRLDQNWTMEKGGDGYVYIISSAFSRAISGMVLQRVREEEILDKAAYEPRGWTEEHGWLWGQPCTPILPDQAGEMSLRRIQGTWVLSYFDSAGYRIAIRTAAHIDGGWTAPVTAVKGGAWGAESGDTVAQLYGGYIHPESRLDDLHLIVSQWNTEKEAKGWPYRAMQFRSSIPPAVETSELADQERGEPPVTAPA